MHYTLIVVYDHVIYATVVTQTVDQLIAGAHAPGLAKANISGAFIPPVSNNYRAIAAPGVVEVRLDTLYELIRHTG